MTKKEKRAAAWAALAPLNPYLQVYLVAMESGAVLLVRVMGEDRPHGEGLAHNVAQEALPGQIWSAAPYPCGPEERAKGEGFEVLKEAPADLARRKAINSADLARAIGPEYRGAR